MRTQNQQAFNHLCKRSFYVGSINRTSAVYMSLVIEDLKEIWFPRTNNWTCYLRDCRTAQCTESALSHASHGQACDSKKQSLFSRAAVSMNAAVLVRSWHKWALHRPEASLEKISRDRNMVAEVVERSTVSIVWAAWKRRFTSSTKYFTYYYPEWKKLLKSARHIPVKTSEFPCTRRKSQILIVKNTEAESSWFKAEREPCTGLVLLKHIRVFRMDDTIR